MRKNLAVIYCRVSSEKQFKDGSGLESQEMSCRLWAEKNGYEIKEVFKEPAVSGKQDSRPVWNKLLEYLDEKGGDSEYTVIVDNLDRFARDLYVHLSHKKQLEERGAVLRSPNFKFEDTNENYMLEVINAVTSDYERRNNAARVIRCQKARLLQGYWCHGEIHGYKFVLQDGEKVIVPKRVDYIEVLAEAIKLFADGALLSQEEAREYINMKRLELGMEGNISPDTTNRILKQVLYTGYINKPEWGVEMVQGVHKAIISIDTYRQVQERLSQARGTRKSKSSSGEYPLKGFVFCSNSEGKFTAGGSKGNGGRYGYYRCFNNECPLKGKGVRVEKIESEFIEALDGFRAKERVLRRFERTFSKVWERRVVVQEKAMQRSRNEIRKLEGDIDGLVNSLGKINNDIAIKRVEQKINIIQKEIEDKEESLRDTIDLSKEDPRPVLNEVLNQMKNPKDMWLASDSSSKEALIKLLFGGKLLYQRNVGFEPFIMTESYSLLIDSEALDTEVVQGAGFEPA